MVFSGYSGFLHHINWLPRCYWNIVKSAVKHHKPNHTIYHKLIPQLMVWVNKTSLTLPLLTEVAVPNQKRIVYLLVRGCCFASVYDFSSGFLELFLLCGIFLFFILSNHIKLESKSTITISVKSMHIPDSFPYVWSIDGRWCTKPSRHTNLSPMSYPHTLEFSKSHATSPITEKNKQILWMYFYSWVPIFMVYAKCIENLKIQEFVVSNSACTKSMEKSYYVGFLIFVDLVYHGIHEN